MRLVVVLCFALGACETGSRCQPQACSMTNATYSLCPAAKGIVYDFGETTCLCSPTDAISCRACAQAVASFCAGPADGGVNVDVGTEPTTCNAIFSGGATGSWSSCAFSIAVTTTPPAFTIATRGSLIPNGNLNTWTGLTLSVSGTPAVGTFDESMSIGAAEQVSNLTINNSPLWLAESGQGSTIGTMSVRIDTLGPALTVGDGNSLYNAPHGTAQSTLLDQNTTTNAPNVTVAVMF